MDIEIINFLLSGISHLSKFRLVTQKIPQGSLIKDFYKFPPEFILNKFSIDNQDFIRSKIKSSSQKSCNFYQIPHNIYSEIKNDHTNEKISHERFDVLKNYFSVLKLKEMKTIGNVEIKISSRERIIEIPLPISVMDLDDKIIKQYGDAFIEFTREQDREKFPIFYSELLFKQLNLFPEGEIRTIKDRRKSVGKKSDRKSIAKRFVVLDKDKICFLKAYDYSFDNIYKFVDDNNLHEKLILNHQEFEKYKKSKEYWNTLKSD